MTILAWIVLGLISGFIASLIVRRRDDGVALDTALGVAGALVGGLVFNAVAVGAMGFEVWSPMVAVVGAALVLATYHAVSRRHHLA
jgi:uncharacterized membrane protein YeaQ/YmgE (transglycosylase-associated protein family)